MCEHKYMCVDREHENNADKIQSHLGALLTAGTTVCQVEV